VRLSLEQIAPLQNTAGSDRLDSCTADPQKGLQNLAFLGPDRRRKVAVPRCTMKDYLGRFPEKNPDGPAASPLTTGVAGSSSSSYRGGKWAEALGNRRTGIYLGDLTVVFVFPVPLLKTDARESKQEMTRSLIHRAQWSQVRATAASVAQVAEMTA
jgi:hypothetical protein